MADRFLSLAAFFSRRGGNGNSLTAGEMPQRPLGVVIWVRALRPEHLNALTSLEEQLRADGDQISLVVTLPTDYEDTFKTPEGRAEIGMFLAHWKPDLVLWIEADLDPATFFELSQSNIQCMLISATKDALRPTSSGWLPGVGRSMLRQFASIMTVDEDVQMLFGRNGVDPKKLETLGVLEGAPTPLSHFEDERQDFAQRLGARTVWLAAAAGIDEIAPIAVAHHTASRRAHRLLLIVALRDASQGAEAAEKLQNEGFTVALRSADEDVTESTQVYIADTEGELGLWYRLAPITYLGGSLSGGPCRDPFEPATLGSAVLHGPNVSPFERQIERLALAQACISLKTFSELGKTVERLLSPDKTAQIVHAAWDVTSRGADVTNRLAEAIVAHLDEIGA